MVPNTFSGATWTRCRTRTASYDYVFGYLRNVKPRESNDFISMSDQLAGAGVSSRGVRSGW